MQPFKSMTEVSRWQIHIKSFKKINRIEYVKMLNVNNLQNTITIVKGSFCGYSIFSLLLKMQIFENKTQMELKQLKNYLQDVLYRHSWSSEDKSQFLLCRFATQYLQNKFLCHQSFTLIDKC